MRLHTQSGKQSLYLALDAENQSLCWHAGAMPEEDTCTQYLSNGGTVPRTL